MIKRIAFAAIGVAMMAIPAAQAQQSFGGQQGPRHGAHRPAPAPQAQHHNARPGHPQAQRPHARPGHSHAQRPNVRPGHPHAHAPRWQRGQRYGDWRRHGAVHDYHRYGLRRPGPGQHWVRVGNDYLLVSAATGLIASIIAASR